MGPGGWFAVFSSLCVLFPSFLPLSFASPSHVPVRANRAAELCLQRLAAIEANEADIRSIQPVQRCRILVPVSFDLF